MAGGHSRDEPTDHPTPRGFMNRRHHLGLLPRTSGSAYPHGYGVRGHQRTVWTIAVSGLLTIGLAFALLHHFDVIGAGPPSDDPTRDEPTPDDPPRIPHP